MRLGIYTDMVYRSDGETITTNRAFVRFVTSLPPRVDEVVLFGRLHPEPGRTTYGLDGDAIRFVALPYYPRITAVASMLAAVRESWRIFTAELERLDAVWVFGPQPMAVVFASAARRRSTPLILGVRQDYPRYIASRLPGPAWRWAVPAARVLEAAFRRMSRTSATVALGEDIAARYSAGAPVLATGFSLVSRLDIVSLEAALARPWAGQLRVLSVGRLDPEKNPMLLLDIAAGLRAREPAWKLLIAGDGPLRRRIDEEISRRGLGDCVEMLGEIPNGPELWSLYRRSHVFLHVSLTEGLPQVLFEAQAAGLPVVATAVGGVPGALRQGATGLLVDAQDSEAAIAALERLRLDRGRREELVGAGLAAVSSETLEDQLDRVAAFIRQASAPTVLAVAAAGPDFEASRARRPAGWR